MDADHFDRLTKSFSALMTRRRSVGLLTALGLGSRTPAAVSAAKKGRQQRGGAHADATVGADRTKRSAGACQVSENDTLVTTTITVKQKRLKLTQVDKTPRNPEEAWTRTTTIRKRQALLLEITTTLDATVDITIIYGKAFNGVQQANLSVASGVVSGTIDGREIVPFNAANVPDTLQFEDGQPGPKMAVGEEVRKQLAQIFARAQEKQLECAPAETSTARSRVRAEDTGDCLLLKGACVLASSQCGWAAAAGCAPSLAIPFAGPGIYGFCIAAAMVACVAASTRCLQTARESRACCPVECGDLPDWSCCEEGEQCLTPSSNFGVCCPRDTTPCHETSCCDPFEKCRPDGQCCRLGTSPCGNSNCCPDTQTCMRDGSCCPDGKVCNGTGGTCCGPDQSCVNNECRVVCNPERQVTCPDLPGYPDCCEKGTICCAGGQCCPLFLPICCGDGCCLSSQECCPDNICRSNCLR